MPDMRIIKVALADRSYDIHIGTGLIARAGELLAPIVKQPRVIIITDSNVAKHYLLPFTVSLSRANIRYEVIELPVGEKTKDFTHLNKLVDEILSYAPDRNTTIVALGGGVIGDIAGFAASIVLRGIPFIQVPTTLLAQVDSSVGGKTGINTPHGKNLVGSFYQPRLVIADVETLTTLSKRELLAGYAETVKYGLVNNKPFFEWLEKYGAHLIAGDMKSLAEAVTQACKAKADIVARDEREGSVRALLNFGHTFGHALETETRYSDELLHGEAVAIGMIMVLQFSERRGLCAKEDVERVKAHFISTGLHTAPTDIRAKWDAKKLLQHMAHDKKAKDGGLTFILSRGIGQAFVAENISSPEVLTVLDEILKTS